MRILRSLMSSRISQNPPWKNPEETASGTAITTAALKKHFMFICLHVGCGQADGAPEILGTNDCLIAAQDSGRNLTSSISTPKGTR